MCQTRKGTSTRKPKLNRQIVEEQSLIARTILKEQRQDEADVNASGTTGRKRGRHSNSTSSGNATLAGGAAIGSISSMGHKNGAVLATG